MFLVGVVSIFFGWGCGGWGVDIFWKVVNLFWKVGVL